MTRVWVRDAAGVPRLIALQLICLLPALLWTCYAVGRQSLRVMAASEIAPANGGRLWLIGALSRYDAASVWDAWCYGAFHILPLAAVVLATAGLGEYLLARQRQRVPHPEMLLHGLLLTLLLPAGLSLGWAVVAGLLLLGARELGGGAGRYRVQPVAAGGLALFALLLLRPAASVLPLEGSTYVTLLQVALTEGYAGIAPYFSGWDGFWGLTPARIGGAAPAFVFTALILLCGAGLRSWRPATATLLALGGAAIVRTLLPIDAPVATLPWHWHLTLGNTAVLLLLASDPVTAPVGRVGQWCVGIAIGLCALLLRELTPLVEEAVPLAIVFGNLLVPVFDRISVRRAIRQRQTRLRAAARPVI